MDIKQRIEVEEALKTEACEVRLAVERQFAALAPFVTDLLQNGAFCAIRAAGSVVDACGNTHTSDGVADIKTGPAAATLLRTE